MRAFKLRRPLPAIAHVAILLCGAWCNVMGQLASNLTLSRSVPAHRLGLSFGVKQAAIPLATLLAGAAVPAVALTVGWRWAYVIASGLAVLALLGAPRGGEYVRAPQADGTLVKLPVGEADELMPSLLTLSDVFSTGHHAARTARGDKGSTGIVCHAGTIRRWPRLRMRSSRFFSGGVSSMRKALRCRRARWLNAGICVRLRRPCG